MRLERRFSVSSGDPELRFMKLSVGTVTSRRVDAYGTAESALQNRGYAAQLRLDWAGGAGLASSGLCFAQPDGADG
jgi:hypothetical protein